MSDCTCACHVRGSYISHVKACCESEPMGNPDIKKCDRCPQIEELAEGYRIALIEAAKLIEFILLPSTTDADRAEIREKAFGPPSGPQKDQNGPPTPSTTTEAPKTPLEDLLDTGEITDCI